MKCASRVAVEVEEAVKEEERKNNGTLMRIITILITSK